MRITIANRWRAQELMSDPRAGLTHIVSIGANHPIQAARKLRLEFFDIACGERDGMNGPSRDDVEKLVAFFGEVLQSEDANVLIHCYAGKSRSVAAGLILLAMAHRDGTKAWEELAKLVPEPSPNQRMLRLASEILGR